MASQTEQLEDRVERIVRDVLGKLGAKDGSAVAAVGQQSKVNDSTAPSKESNRPSQLTLCDRLITLAVIDGRLDGMQELSVPTGAVVTPAARDVLRERGIQLVRRHEAGGTARHAQGAVVVGVAACGVEPVSIGRLQGVLGVPLEPLARVGLVEVVWELSEQIVLGGKRGLLFTAEPATALCLANRKPGIRAVAGRDADEVRRSAPSVGANLLVIQPEGLTTWRQLQMAREFVNGGSGRCPAEYAQWLA